jgi:dTDP-4-dehydrorhamnose reductase
VRAATDIEACERDPALAHRLNTEMAQGVARAAAETGARLLHLSTDAVFDGADGSYREDQLPAPLNVYGKTKLAGEAAVSEAHPGALVVRTNFFGWNAKPKVNLAEWFLDRFARANGRRGSPMCSGHRCWSMISPDLYVPPLRRRDPAPARECA